MRQRAQDHRIPSIDYFRFFAIMAILFLHAHIFDGAYARYRTGNADQFLPGVVEVAISQGAGFAVPFFFIIAGYLFGKKIAGGNAPTIVLAHQAKRLFVPWSFWILFYFFVPVQNYWHFKQYGYHEYLLAKFDYVAQDPLRIVNNGAGVGILYFLAYLIIALGVITLFLRFRGAKVVLPLFSLLYGLRLVTTLYAATPPGASIKGWYAAVPALSLLDAVLEHYSSSIFFVAFGWWLSTRKRVLPAGYAASIAVAGMALSYVEFVLFYDSYAGVLAGTVPYAGGIAMIAIAKPDLGRNSVITWCGRMSLGIYTTHIISISLVSSGIGLLGRYWLILSPVFVYCLSLLIVVLLARNRLLRPLVM